jgi:hypothetical protein
MAPERVLHLWCICVTALHDYQRPPFDSYDNGCAEVPVQSRQVQLIDRMVVVHLR